VDEEEPNRRGRRGTQIHESQLLLYLRLSGKKLDLPLNVGAREGKDRSLTSDERSYWDGIGRDWQQTRPQGLWRTHCAEVEGDLFARWMPAGRAVRILKTDLFGEALGEGTFPTLERRGKRVVGIDLSTTVTRAARDRHDTLAAVEADVRNLPFSGESFDVVVSNSTLDHFRSQEEITLSLRELHRVLAPGGILLLTIDNLLNPVIALRNHLPFGLLNRLGIVPYYVGATFTPRRARRRLEEIGFEPSEFTTIMHFPRVVAVGLSGLMERRASTGAQRAFVRMLARFEVLSRWPTRFLTGHFVAVRAIRK